MYADLECLVEKIDGCENNPEISSTAKALNLFYQVFQCLQYPHLKT